VLAGRFGRHDAGAPSTSAEIAELRRELRDTQQLVMLSLLQQASASERLRGVGWSHAIEEPGPEVVSALLDSLTHDPNVNVRLGCVDALMRFSARPNVRQGVVRALNESTSPIVQIALIDFVVEVGEKESVAALRRLSTDTALNEAVRERARWGLQHLL
jgi:HEAT repeats